MDESLEGLSWLISQLEASSSIVAALTGGIWPLQAPEGTPLPYAVVSPMGGHDKMGVAGIRLFWEGPYSVRFWGYATGSDALKVVDNTADALLQRTNGTTSTATIMSCIRDNPLPVLPEWDGQQLRIGIGGLYRLQVRPS